VGGGAEGGEGWDGRALGGEEEAGERGWAGGAEGAAEGRGRADGVEEGTAAEGSTYEARQGGEAEKDRFRDPLRWWQQAAAAAAIAGRPWPWLCRNGESIFSSRSMCTRAAPERIGTTRVFYI
jgi:hypothetical protein